MEVLKFKWIAILCVISFVYSIDISTDYDKEVAERGLYYAAAAYCYGCESNDQLFNWTCPQTCGLVPGVNVSSIITGNGNGDSVSLDQLVFIARNDALKEVIVSFRGTVNDDLWQWIYTTHVEKVPWDPAVPNALIMRGFHQFYAIIRNDTLYNLNSLLKDVPSEYRILIVGHSMGGCLATLLALDISEKVSDRVVSVVTYGQPRLGNEDFVDLFTKSSNAVLHRVVHFRDPIPHIPLLQWEYSHCGTEVWYPQEEMNLDSQYNVCAENKEDPKCCDSISVPIEVSDHTHYFGIGPL